MSKIVPITKNRSVLVSALIEATYLEPSADLPSYGLFGAAAPQVQPAWMSAPAVYVPLFDAHEHRIAEAVAEKAATQPTLH